MPYSMPVPTDILIQGQRASDVIDQNELKALSDLLEDSFRAFKLNLKVVNIKPTPTIIRFELAVGKGVRVNEVRALRRDLQLLMKVTSLGIEAPINGTNLVGIDIPNNHKIIARLRNVLDSESFQKASETTVALGSNINNNPLLFDIATHQHLLITGSNAREIEDLRNSIVVSILCKAPDRRLRILMIDPLNRTDLYFDGIPHLIEPIASSAQDSLKVMNLAISMMNERINELARNRVKSIDKLPRNGIIHPHIVFFINSIDDLMQVNPSKIYYDIWQLISKGAYVGIHLIITTRVNLRTQSFKMINDRIRDKVVFSVNSVEQSLSTIYHDGAESLSGNGDMYFFNRPTNTCIRSNSPIVTPIEIHDATEWIKENH